MLDEAQRTLDAAAANKRREMKRHHQNALGHERNHAEVQLETWSRQSRREKLWVASARRCWTTFGDCSRRRQRFEPAAMSLNSLAVRSLPERMSSTRPLNRARPCAMRSGRAGVPSAPAVRRLRTKEAAEPARSNSPRSSFAQGAAVNACRR